MKVREKDSPTSISNKLDKPTYVAEVLTVWKFRILREASGTSGEKALMNGVVNFSVLDGWWLEGYREGAGWALTEKRTYQNQEHQDQLDASNGRVGVFNQISTPETRRRASCIS